jgi:hypothetical protein
MAALEVISKQYVPLTCHGHSRPVTHLSFSDFVDGHEEEYYLISACKGQSLPLFSLARSHRFRQQPNAEGWYYRRLVGAPD